MLARCAGQQGHGGDQRNGCKVLEQQNGEGLATVGRTRFLPFGENLQAKGGGRQRKAGANDGRCVYRETKQVVARHADDQTAGQHLQQAGAKHLASHHPQSLRRQLQANDEQHQHHAEFGDGRHAGRVTDEAQLLRPDHDARKQIAQHRAQLEPLGQRHRNDRRHQEHQRRLQKMVAIHARAPFR